MANPPSLNEWKSQRKHLVVTEIQDNFYYPCSRVHSDCIGASYFLCWHFTLIQNKKSHCATAIWAEDPHGAGTKHLGLKAYF